MCVVVPATSKNDIPFGYQPFENFITVLCLKNMLIRSYVLIAFCFNVIINLKLNVLSVLYNIL